MPTPSLLIVPARFKTGRLYSQLPTSGGDFTVTRATAATRVNASGLIESVASGIPRLDYYTSGGTAGCPALLVEPSGQNLALQSEGFNVSATWTSLSGGTGVVPVVTQATDIVDPAGGTTAERIQLSVGSGTLSTDFSILRQTLTFTAVAHTFSVYLRSATSGSQFVAIRFNSAPQTIIEITPSWQRFTFTGTPSAGSRDFGFDLRGNNASASGSADFYAWGAQIETGSIATSYIPTTTGSVTRNADVVTVSGAVSGSIGQTQGTIYLDLTVLGKGSSTSARYLQIFGASNNIGLAINSSNQFRSIVNTQSDTLLTAPLISSGVKVAWAYDATGTTCFINGTQYTLTLGGNQTMSSLTSIIIDGSASSSLGFARIRAAALYTTRLTNAELAALTTP